MIVVRDVPTLFPLVPVGVVELAFDLVGAVAEPHMKWAGNDARGDGVYGTSHGGGPLSATMSTVSIGAGVSMGESIASTTSACEVVPLHAATSEANATTKSERIAGECTVHA